MHPKSGMATGAELPEADLNGTSRLALSTLCNAGCCTAIPLVGIWFFFADFGRTYVLVLFVSFWITIMVCIPFAIAATRRALHEGPSPVFRYYLSEEELVVRPANGRVVRYPIKDMLSVRVYKQSLTHTVEPPILCGRRRPHLDGTPEPVEKIEDARQAQGHVEACRHFLLRCKSTCACFFAGVEVRGRRSPLPFSRHVVCGDARGLEEIFDAAAAVDSFYNRLRLNAPSFQGPPARQLVPGSGRSAPDLGAADGDLEAQGAERPEEPDGGSVRGEKAVRFAENVEDLEAQGARQPEEPDGGSVRRKKAVRLAERAEEVQSKGEAVPDGLIAI